MIRQFFKIVFKRKKQSLALMLQLCLCFVAIAGIATVVSLFLSNKSHTLGYQYENVYEVDYYPTIHLPDSLIHLRSLQIEKAIESHKKVEGIGDWNYNILFSRGYAHLPLRRPLKYQEVSLPPETIDLSFADDNLADILSIPIAQGRWFAQIDDAAKYRPVVINKKLKQRLFGEGKGIGEIINYCGQECKVVGVIKDFRFAGEYSSPGSHLIIREVGGKKVSYFKWHSYSTDNAYTRSYLKAKEALTPREEQLILTEISRKFPKWEINIDSVEEHHFKYLVRIWTPLILISVIIILLLVNTLTGIFGQLWYSINQRKAEIGLRIATGARKQHIYFQFMGETCAIATIGMVFGSLITLQFLFLDPFGIEAGIYLSGMLVSMLIIYLSVTLCAWAPSTQAARLQPATALKED